MKQRMELIEKLYKYEQSTRNLSQKAEKRQNMSNLIDGGFTLI